MDNDIENIFKEQAKLLPPEVRQFIMSGDLEKKIIDITARFQLSEDNTNSLRTEIALVLAGLVSINEFRSTLSRELQGIASATLDALADEIEMSVFVQVRPILERFFAEMEVAEEQEEIEKEEAEQAPDQPPAKTLEKMPDIAPDNLPTGEEVENLVMPNLTPKPAPEEKIGGKEEAHPFEEKMKKVFTGTGAAIEDLAIETPIERKISVSNDPYREPIE